jgi:hypothetical protein
MMRADRLVGLAVAVVVAFALAWLSQAPVESGQSEDGTLRLAWRARPERIEVCQQQDSESLAALPQHMRQAVICEGESASYQLHVWANGRLLAERIVEPGGLRRDRPLYVFLELPMAPGEADVRVRLSRIDPPGQTSPAGTGGDGADASSTRERRGELSEALPPLLAYEQRLHFAPRQVHLITYAPERRALIEVGPAAD